MIEFDQGLVELAATGTTAALLLDAIKMICADGTTRIIDRAVEDVVNSRLTPDMAMTHVVELVTLRRIVLQQEQRIAQGKAARARMEHQNG